MTLSRKSKTLRNFLIGFALSLALPLLSGCATPQSTTALPSPTTVVGAFSPSSDYAKVYEGDPVPITEIPNYYRAEVTGIYDPDTWEVRINQGFDTWKEKVRIRLVGTDAYEITRKGGTTAAEVLISKTCRKEVVRWLGADVSLIGDKAKLYPVRPPVPVILETDPKNENEKFGRVLPVVNHDGRNINQFIARSGCSPYVTYYEKGLLYDPRTPIFIRSPKERGVNYEQFISDPP